MTKNIVTINLLTGKITGSDCDRCLDSGFVHDSGPNAGCSEFFSGYCYCLCPTGQELSMKQSRKEDAEFHALEEAPF